MWLSIVAILLGTLPEPAGVEAAFQRMDGVRKCKTLQFQVDITCRGGIGMTTSLKGRLAVAPGDKVRVELEGATAGRPKKIVLVSDGKTLKFTNLGAPSQTSDTKRHLGDAYRGMLSRAGVFFGMFTQAAPGQEGVFEPEKVFPVSDVKLGKKKVVAGSEAQVIEYNLNPGGYNEPLAVKVWVDARTGLPVKRVVTQKRGKEPVFMVTESYTKVVIDGKIDEKEFELPR